MKIKAMLWRLKNFLQYGLSWRKPMHIITTIRNILLAKLCYRLGIKKFVLRGLDIAVSYACNFRCAHCYTQELYAQKKGQRTLKPADYVRIVKEMERLGGNTVSLQGGEPLLQEDLLAIIRACNPGRNRIVMTSNGSLLTEGKISELRKAGVDAFYLSVDSGIPEEHDKFRGFPGSFDKIWKVIEILQKHKISIIINTVLTHKNVRSESLQKLAKLCCDRGILLCCIFARPSGRWMGNADVLLTPEDIKYYDNIIREKWPNILRGDTQSSYTGCTCLGVKEFIYISPYGDVYPCPLTHIRFGNVFEDSIKTIRDRGLSLKWYDHYHHICLSTQDVDFKKKYFGELAKRGVVEWTAMREGKEDVYKSWDRFWREHLNYHLTPTGKMIIKQKKRTLFSILQNMRPQSAIDVGSGLGNALEEFVRADISVTGIDVSERSVEICRKKGLPAVLKRLEDVNEKYELVYSDGLIEHFPDFKPHSKMLADISSHYVLLSQTDHSALIVKILDLAERLFKKDHYLREKPFKLFEFIKYYESIGFKLKSKKSVFFGGFVFLLFEKK